MSNVSYKATLSDPPRVSAGQKARGGGPVKLVEPRRSAWQLHMIGHLLTVVLLVTLMPVTAIAAESRVAVADGNRNAPEMTVS